MGWFWWADKLENIHLVQADSWQQVSGKWPASVSIEGPFTSNHAAQVWHSDNPGWPFTPGGPIGGGPGSGGGGGGGGPGPVGGGGGGGGGTPEPRFDSSKFISIIQGAIGDPYAWGGTTPAGFDCSGLVWWGLTTLGYHGVPRTSEEQWAWVKKIGQADLRAGDLIFENFPGEASPGHVLIYAGGGKAIQAASPGTLVAEAAWSPQTAGGTVVGYGRIPELSFTGGGNGTGSFLGLGWPSGLTTAFDDLDKILKAAFWLLQPSNWVRITAGAFAVIFLVAGLLFLMKAA